MAGTRDNIAETLRAIHKRLSDFLSNNPPDQGSIDQRKNDMRLQIINEEIDIVLIKIKINREQPSQDKLLEIVSSLQEIQNGVTPELEDLLHGDQGVIRALFDVAKDMGIDKDERALIDRVVAQSADPDVEDERLNIADDASIDLSPISGQANPEVDEFGFDEIIRKNQKESIAELLQPTQVVSDSYAKAKTAENRHVNALKKFITDNKAKYPEIIAMLQQIKIKLDDPTQSYSDKHKFIYENMQQLENLINAKKASIAAQAQPRSSAEDKPVKDNTDKLLDELDKVDGVEAEDLLRDLDELVKDSESPDSLVPQTESNSNEPENNSDPDGDLDAQLKAFVSQPSLKERMAKLRGEVSPRETLDSLATLLNDLSQDYSKLIALGRNEENNLRLVANVFLAKAKIPGARIEDVTNAIQACNDLANFYVSTNQPQLAKEYLSRGASTVTTPFEGSPEGAKNKLNVEYAKTLKSYTDLSTNDAEKKTLSGESLLANITQQQQDNLLAEKAQEKRSTNLAREMLQVDGPYKKLFARLQDAKAVLIQAVSKHESLKGLEKLLAYIDVLQDQNLSPARKKDFLIAFMEQFQQVILPMVTLDEIKNVNKQLQEIHAGLISEFTKLSDPARMDQLEKEVAAKSGVVAEPSQKPSANKAKSNESRKIASDYLFGEMDNLNKMQEGFEKAILYYQKYATRPETREGKRWQILTDTINDLQSLRTAIKTLHETASNDPNVAAVSEQVSKALKQLDSSLPVALASDDVQHHLYFEKLKQGKKTKIASSLEKLQVSVNTGARLWGVPQAGELTIAGNQQEHAEAAQKMIGVQRDLGDVISKMENYLQTHRSFAGAKNVKGAQFETAARLLANIYILQSQINEKQYLNQLLTIRVINGLIATGEINRHLHDPFFAKTFQNKSTPLQSLVVNNILPTVAAIQSNATKEVASRQTNPEANKALSPEKVKKLAKRPAKKFATVKPFVSPDVADRPNEEQLKRGRDLDETEKMLDELEENRSKEGRPAAPSQSFSTVMNALHEMIAEIDGPQPINAAQEPTADVQPILDLQSRVDELKKQNSGRKTPQITTLEGVLIALKKAENDPVQQVQVIEDIIAREKAMPRVLTNQDFDILTNVRDFLVKKAQLAVIDRVIERRAEKGEDLPASQAMHQVEVSRIRHIIRDSEDPFKQLMKAKKGKIELSTKEKIILVKGESVAQQEAHLQLAKVKDITPESRQAEQSNLTIIINRLGRLLSSLESQLVKSKNMLTFFQAEDKKQPEENADKRTPKP